MKNRIILLACVGLMLGSLLSGCATISTPNVQAFSQGITTAKTQADTAFKGVNDLTAPAVIDYAAKRPTLNDANFLVVLDSESTAGWDLAFTALEKYGQDLALLTSPDLTKDFQDSAVNLAQQIQQTGQSLQTKPPAGSTGDGPTLLATGFTKLGDSLLKMYAQHEAKKVIESTDPIVTGIFTQMAAAIGDNQKTGVRGTVNAHWNQIKGGKQVEFTSAGNDDAKKHSLAVDYASLIDQQQAQDLSLASLRRSLLALAQAHHALTKADNVSAAQFISQVNGELADTKTLYDRFKGVLKNGETSK